MVEKVSMTLSIISYNGLTYALSVYTKDRRVKKVLEELGLYVNSSSKYDRKYNFQRVMSLIGKKPEDYGLDDVLDAWWDTVGLDNVHRLVEAKDELMQDIATYLGKMMEIITRQTAKKVIELVPTSPIPSSLPKKKLSKRVFMQVGDTVYEVELKKVKDIENIDELPELIEEKVREQVELEYAALIEDLKSEIEDLRTRLKEASAKAIKEAWRYFGSIFKMGWEVTEDGKFLYPGRIYAKYVKVQEDDRLITYKIPEKYRKFYVEGIIFDPEWNKVEVEKAFSPHVTDHVCTGDYKFTLENLDSVFEMFETIYLNSMFNNMAAAEIIELYHSGELIKVKEEVVAYVE